MNAQEMRERGFITEILPHSSFTADADKLVEKYSSLPPKVTLIRGYIDNRWPYLHVAVLSTSSAMFLDDA